jgi:hypothetical protein
MSEISQDIIRELQDRLHKFPLTQIKQQLPHLFLHVAQHPEDIPRVGLAPAEGKDILVNTGVLAKFMKGKVNSINRALKRAKYRADRNYDPTSKLRALIPDQDFNPKLWTKRVLMDSESGGLWDTPVMNEERDFEQELGCSLDTESMDMDWSFPERISPIENKETSLICQCILVA